MKGEVLNYFTKSVNHYIVILILGLAFFIPSCKDDAVTQDPNNISFSYVQSADTADNTGNLSLDTVKILLEDIKLNVANSSDSSNSKTGPFVLYLDLSTAAGIKNIGANMIPEGTYDKIQFKVHKLGFGEVPPDPEFVNGGGTYSIIAKGTYNNFRFVYRSEVSAKQKLNFPNSLVVTQTTTNVTIKIQPYIWFIDPLTNEYLSPFDPANRSKIDNNIKDNIKENFKAFKDNDMNGIPD